MFEEFLTSDMGYGQLADKMKTHLSSRYRWEDWKEIKKVLFSGDGDNGLALQNVRAIRPQYVSLLVPSQSSVSCTPAAGSSRWQNTVDSIASRFGTSGRDRSEDTRSPILDSPLQIDHPLSTRGRSTSTPSLDDFLNTNCWIVDVLRKFMIPFFSIILYSFEQCDRSNSSSTIGTRSGSQPSNISISWGGYVWALGLLKTSELHSPYHTGTPSSLCAQSCMKKSRTSFNNLHWRSRAGIT